METIKKRAIITGGKGFIGSHLAEKLNEIGWEVLIFDKKDGQDFDFVVFENIKREIDKFKPDYVFHLGAIPAIKISIEDPLATMINNVMGTVNVLEAAKHGGVKRVVLISSAAVYGAKNLGEREKISEDRMLNILNPYAISKKWLEDAGKLWSSKEIWSGVETVSLRYFNIYGPRQTKSSAYGTCIENFLEQWKNKKPFTVTGNGLQRRDFISVSDVIEATVRAALSEKIKPGEVINIGSGKNYSVLEVADIMGGKDYPRVFIESRPGEARSVLADISKAKELLDWEPKISLEEGLNMLKEQV